MLIAQIRCDHDGSECRLLGSAIALAALGQAISELKDQLVVELNERSPDPSYRHSVSRIEFAVTRELMLIAASGTILRITGSNDSLDRLSGTMLHLASRRSPAISDHVHIDSDTLDFIQPPSIDLIVEKSGTDKVG